MEYLLSAGPLPALETVPADIISAGGLLLIARSLSNNHKVKPLYLEILAISASAFSSHIIPKVSYGAITLAEKLCFELSYDIKHGLTEQILNVGINIATTIGVNNIVLQLVSHPEIKSIDQTIGMKSTAMVRPESQEWKDDKDAKFVEIPYKDKHEHAVSYVQNIISDIKGFFASWNIEHNNQNTQEVLNGNYEGSSLRNTSPMKGLPSFSSILLKESKLNELAEYGTEGFLQTAAHGTNSLLLLGSHTIVGLISYIMPAVFMNRLPGGVIARSLFVTAVVTSESMIQSISDLLDFLSKKYSLSMQSTANSKKLIDAMVDCMREDGQLSAVDKQVIKQYNDHYMRSFGCKAYHIDDVALSSKFNRDYCDQEYGNIEKLSTFLYNIDKTMTPHEYLPSKDDRIARDVEVDPYDGGHAAHNELCTRIDAIFYESYLA